MGDKMPIFADWLAQNVKTDQGFAVMLFVAGIALAWLLIARFELQSLLSPLAKVLFIAWAVTGAILLISLLTVHS